MRYPSFAKVEGFEIVIYDQNGDRTSSFPCPCYHPYGCIGAVVNGFTCKVTCITGDVYLCELDEKGNKKICHIIY